ncbi:hypothetical protein MMC19_001300 [Ptychographa xylographoides]|nr:hypothetical protein [Ptychographa xylographoides]
MLELVDQTGWQKDRHDAMFAAKVQRKMHRIRQEMLESGELVRDGLTYRILALKGDKETAVESKEILQRIKDEWRLLKDEDTVLLLQWVMQDIRDNMTLRRAVEHEVV